MTRSRFALPILAAFALVGCRHTEPALLQTTEPDAPTVEYAITIPEGYEVRSAGFGAAYATSVSGGEHIAGVAFPVTGSSSQQTYVHVYAVEQATGQEVLLVYGDLRRRAEPVVLVRLERGGRLRVAR